jgi:hypothetical protein
MTHGPHIQEAVRREWDRCAEEGAPLSVLLVAPDRATAADQVAIVTQLERAVRVHCARHRDRILPHPAGGLVAILPHTLPHGANSVGRQIVEAMHHAPEPTATVAVGVAVVVPSENGESAILLHRAERALQAAREQGGDRCLGGSPPPPPAGQTLARLRGLLPIPRKGGKSKRLTD